MSNKSKFRSKLTGTRARPGRLVKFQFDGDEIEVELREPNQAVKGEIARRAGIDDGKKADIAILAINLIAECSYEPGTNERMFSSKDVEALLNLGPEIDPLIAEAIKLFNGGEDPGNESRATPS